jgi:hypothetical protein
MKIGETKTNKIKEDILSLLYRSSPKALFTSEIASEIARDEEFTKRLLQELEKKRLIVAIKKSPDGLKYSRRTRWRLSSIVYKTYKSIQEGSTKAAIVR